MAGACSFLLPWCKHAVRPGHQHTPGLEREQHLWCSAQHHGPVLACSAPSLQAGLCSARSGIAATDVWAPWSPALGRAAAGAASGTRGRGSAQQFPQSTRRLLERLSCQPGWGQTEAMPRTPITSTRRVGCRLAHLYLSPPSRARGRGAALAPFTPVRHLGGGHQSRGSCLNRVRLPSCACNAQRLPTSPSLAVPAGPASPAGRRPRLQLH